MLPTLAETIYWILIHADGADTRQARALTFAEHDCQAISNSLIKCAVGENLLASL